MPHIQLTADYEYNQLSNLGEQRSSADTHLVGTQLRLALNPRVQFITFLQYNTASERTTLNSRFVWEYQPLSYIYLVFNENQQDIAGAGADPTVRLRDQQGIFKVTFLKQF